MTRKVESAKKQHGLVLHDLLTHLTPGVYMQWINRAASPRGSSYHHYSILLPGCCLPGCLHTYSAAASLGAAPCPPCTPQSRGGMEPEGAGPAPLHLLQSISPCLLRAVTSLHHSLSQLNSGRPLPFPHHCTGKGRAHPIRTS